MEPQIQSILENMLAGNKQLPTVPELYVKFVKMIEDPRVSSREIADLILKDQAMVVKILRLANSALYSKRQEIASLPNAITFLGINTLRNLVLQITLVRVFHFEDEIIPEFNISTFWEHSISTAYFATLLAQEIKLPPSENYYLGGLLHDIGKLVIYQFHPEKFKEIILEQIRSNGKVLDYEAEGDVLGVSHTDIGVYFAKKWNFHQEIIEAIEGHHHCHTFLALHVSLVRLANLFSKAAGLCFPWDHQFFEIVNDPTWEIFSNYCNADIDINKMTEKMMKESDKIKESVKELLEVDKG